MVKVTVFPDIFKTTECTYSEVESVLKAIREGGTLKQLIEELRQLAMIDPVKFKEEKKKLPGICFGGVFTARKNSALTEASGLMILDFDHVEIDFEEKLKADPFIWAFWLSPSGAGYKALVRIPIVKNDEEYKQYFLAFQKRFPNVDPSGKDVARICYFSYDPNMFVNAGAQVWEETVSAGKPTANPEQWKKKPKIQSDFKKVAVIMSMLQNANVGNRHEAILKAGRLAGGYVGSGEIDEYDVLNTCQSQIESMMDNPRDFPAQWKTFTDGIEYGKADPIQALSEARGDNLEKKIGKIDRRLDDETWEKVQENYKKGRVAGYHIGWQSMRMFYQVVLGYYTVLYGSPGSGKSQWLLEVLVNLSKFFGFVHVVFLPETGNKEEIFQEIMQIVAGADFYNDHKRQMPQHELQAAYEFTKKHFIVLDDEDLPESMTPEEVMDYVDMIERRDNIKIHTVTIDPWNELRHVYDRVDIYLEDTLRMIRKRTKKAKRHTFIVTHINDQKPVMVNGEAFYPIPTPRDLAGGQTWYRKSFMMLAFWRVIRYRKEEETIQLFGRTLRYNSLLIQVQKTKPKGYGRLGEIELYYNAEQHRYYEDGGRYARPVEEMTPEAVQTSFLDDKDAVPF